MCPLQWKHRVLTTGLPGKSQMFLSFLTGEELMKEMCGRTSFKLTPGFILSFFLEIEPQFKLCALLPGIKDCISQTSLVAPVTKL